MCTPHPPSTHLSLRGLLKFNFVCTIEMFPAERLPVSLRFTDPLILSADARGITDSHCQINALAYVDAPSTGAGGIADSRCQINALFHTIPSTDVTERVSNLRMGLLTLSIGLSAPFDFIIKTG